MYIWKMYALCYIMDENWLNALHMLVVQSMFSRILKHESQHHEMAVYVRLSYHSVWIWNKMEILAPERQGFLIILECWDCCGFFDFFLTACHPGSLTVHVPGSFCKACLKGKTLRLDNVCTITRCFSCIIVLMSKLVSLVLDKETTTLHAYDWRLRDSLK